MLQRIQTLWLLLAVLFTTLTAALPLAGFRYESPEGMVEFSISAYPPLGTMWAMFALLVLCVLVPTVCIFCYRNRPLQIRLCGVEFVLLLGAMVYIVYYIVLTYRMVTQYPGYGFTFNAASVFPVLAAICIWLALRGIIKDEALVRSIDRIR